MPRHYDNIDYTKESVLIVDDDPYVRDTFEQLLAALGFATASAQSGPDALKVMGQARFTFLLTDMNMPDMDGMELIKRASADFPAISIIAMTGYSEGYKYVDVINAGANDFVKKPFELEELEAKVRRIITERRLKEELERLSITDSLTGLYNQRYFYNKLKDEIVRSGRQRRPLSLILFDLDNFKQFNDAHGHLAGDDVLRNVGKIVTKNIREGVDSGYRYGGDEFAVLLIDADLSTAKEIGKRIQDSLRDKIRIEASFGYAKVTETMSGQDLVSEADALLYKEKARHKDRSDTIR